MSIEAPEATDQLEVTTAEAAPPPPPPGTEPRVADSDAGTDEERPVSVLLTSIAVFLSASAAGWMAAGIFRGALPRVVGILGPLIGAGIVAFSYRTRRPSIIQYLALPVAIVVGALLMIPDTTGGSANLPSLIAEAIRAGGVAQPPIPFDPGWKFILLVLTAVLAAAAASLSTGLNKPKLGIFMPVPLIFGAALIQPQEATVISTAISLALVIASLAVAYGVQLAQEGATTGQFELRRLARGAGIVVLLMAALYGLSQAGFLFPETDKDQVIPPKKPEVAPPQPDRVLFTVNSDRPGPWRLGVLDVYDGTAWLLPPYDTKRLVEIGPSGALPESVPASDRAAAQAALQETNPDAPKFTATFNIQDVQGHVLPTIAGAESIKRSDLNFTWDPRTQTMRLLDSRARKGTIYTVEAPAPPDSAALGRSGPAPESMKEFVQVPPPPTEVLTLLQDAPRLEDNPFERLQFVRNGFYQKVIAAGAGNPVDVGPDRVVEMLNGGEATPYEITAAEALLARWAGVPSRIGYGFYAGEKKGGADSQTYEIRPKNGSTYLEAYFKGFGWVPIVGTPPKAKASTSQDEKKQDPTITPSEELALIVYVPIRLQSIQLIYVVVRYWVAVTAPFVIGLLLIWLLYPGVLKIARRQRRRRWADKAGVVPRIVAAYAELRDAANDLNIGYSPMTPLEFLSSVEPDLEHEELAWLFSRSIWGDLTRDLRPQDAEAAEDLASSVTKRMRRAQPMLTRTLGFGSRASLRDPYTDEIPNLWPAWATEGAARRGVRKVVGAPWRRLRRLLPIGAMLLMILVAMSGCAAGEQVRQPTLNLTKPILPNALAPDTLQGYRFAREDKAEAAYAKAGKEGLVAEGRVYTVREGDLVQGALQIGAFKPGLKATEKEIRDGVLSSIGTGKFELTRVGSERIYEQRLPEQRIFVWLPPRIEYYEIFIARQGFKEPEKVFASLLAFQRGEDPTKVGVTGVLDVRRGAPE